MGEGIAGLSLKEAKTIAIPKFRNFAGDNIFARILNHNGSGSTPQIGLKSLLCVPIFESGSARGVLNISTINFHKHFEKSEIQMANEISKRMAHLLKSAE